MFSAENLHFDFKWKIRRIDKAFLHYNYLTGQLSYKSIVIILQENNCLIGHCLTCQLCLLRDIR